MVIKYWLRLLNMPVYRIPKKCYNMMIIYERNGKQTWVIDVRELLLKLVTVRYVMTKMLLHNLFSSCHHVALLLSCKICMY